MTARKRRATAVPSPRKRRAPSPRERRAPQPKGSPGALLRAILDERNERYGAFAARIGVRYHNVQRWMANREFTPENKGICCVALDLPLDTFGDDAILTRVEAAASIRLETKQILDQWLRESPNARGLHRDDIAVMRSVQFAGRVRPSAEFYDALAYALRGAIRVDEILAVEDDNRAVAESLARKPPLPRR